MLFNINHQVRVKLTAHGRAIHAADHAKLWIGSSGYPEPQDADGWSTWQLWRLMQVFGPHIGMGLPNCFDMTIEIVEEAAMLPLRPLAAPSEDPMDAVRKMCR